MLCVHKTINTFIRCVSSHPPFAAFYAALRFAGLCFPFVMLHGRYVPFVPVAKPSLQSQKLSSGNAARPRVSLEAGQLALRTTAVKTLFRKQSQGRPWGSVCVRVIRQERVWNTGDLGH